MKNLKEMRKEAGYTIHQTAERAGVASGLISFSERAQEGGKRVNFKFTTVEKLGILFEKYNDDIHKQFGRIPRDIFYKIVDSKLSFEEIRSILNQAGV